MLKKIFIGFTIVLVIPFIVAVIIKKEYAIEK